MKIVPTDATRYAINCVQLRPSAGRLAATDTHQLLIETGFTFPGVSDVLIPRTTLFSSREVPVDQPVDVGFTVNYGVFRVGPWTFWLTLEKQGRYPRVEDIIPPADSAKTRLSLSADDVSFLLEIVPRLPTETDQQGRITLDLNGQVAMLAKGDGSSPVTQVVLRNSHLTVVRARRSRRIDDRSGHRPTRNLLSTTPRIVPRGVFRRRAEHDKPKKGLPH